MATDDEEAVMVVADGAILDPKASDFRGKSELVTIEECVFYSRKPVIPWFWHDRRYECVR